MSVPKVFWPAVTKDTRKTSRRDALPLRYVDKPQDLAEWVRELEEADVIAVDTESDSFHHYREKVCLIQMTALGQDVIVDPLALGDISPLGPVFADPERIKIFHDAGYDLVCLRRDFGFEFRGLFDTMLASRLLGEQSFGLGAILQRRFGFMANKRLQRSDWARRPLTKEQLEYARYDTHFLPKLLKILSAELKDAGRYRWALEDFERLPEIASRNGREPTFDPESFWRIRGVKALNPVARGRARALYIQRDKIARRLDRPPFKVFGDAVLLDLARTPPKGNKLSPRPGLRRAGVDRFGEEMMRALKDAEPVNGKPPVGTGRRRRPGRLLDPKARKRYECLRDLRKDVADRLGIDPEVLLANATLENIAKTPPETRSELVDGTQLEGWREGLFVQPILTLVERLEQEPAPPKHGKDPIKHHRAKPKEAVAAKPRDTRARDEVPARGRRSVKKGRREG